MTYSIEMSRISLNDVTPTKPPLAVVSHTIHYLKSTSQGRQTDNALDHGSFTHHGLDHVQDHIDVSPPMPLFPATSVTFDLTRFQLYDVIPTSPLIAAVNDIQGCQDSHSQRHHSDKVPIHRDVKHH